MKEQSSIALIIVALFCTLCLMSCGPSKNDAGAELVSVTVTPREPSIMRGIPLQFKAIGHYADNTTKDISSFVNGHWSVYEEFEYQGWISETGLLTVTWGEKDHSSGPIGSVWICGGANWNICGMTYFFAALPASIVVTPVDPSMSVGASLQFTATSVYSDRPDHDLPTSFTWTSSDPGTATISADGLATAAAAGTSIITAKLKGWGAYSEGTTTLTVISAALVSIAITPVDPSVAAGSSLQFTATGTYADASTHDLSSSVTWTSSDPGKATINAAGLATGVAAGTTIISATSVTATNTTTLTVTGGSGTSSTPIISIGTIIKGSGSATVNGIQYSDTLANITADDIVKNAAFLQSGMLVKIKGSRNSDGLTGVADEIHVENAVRGLIHPHFGVDTFEVNGQVAFADGGTIFGNVADFASLIMGVDNVEVYGMRNAAGHVRATRVEKLGAAGVDEVRGTILVKLSGSGSTMITIDGGSFEVDGATTIVPSGAPFDVGTLVEIKLTGYHVDQLKVEDAFDAAFKPAQGDEFAVEGLVTGFTSTSSGFFVEGQEVNASGASFTGGVSAGLANDVKIEAKGHYIGAVLVADTVAIK